MEAPPGFEPGTYAGTKTLCVEPDFTKGLNLIVRIVVYIYDRIYLVRFALI